MVGKVSFISFGILLAIILILSLGIGVIHGADPDISGNSTAAPGSSPWTANTAFPAALASTATLPSSPQATLSPCDQVVVDTANLLGDKISEVEAAAQQLIESGAEVRIRLVPTFGSAADMAAYLASLKLQCPSWMDSSGKAKRNLIVILVSLQERETGLYYGRQWNNVLDTQWNRIVTEIINPRFSQADFAGGVIAGLHEVKSLIQAQPGVQSGPPAMSPSITYSPSVLKYTLTVGVDPAGSGTVSPDFGDYNFGDNVTILATPAAGFDFDYWSGDVTGTSNPVSFNIYRNTDVIAHFRNVSGPQVLFEDQFDDNQNEWWVDNNIYIEDGAIHIIVRHEPVEATWISMALAWPEDSPGVADFGYEADIIPIQCENRDSRGIMFFCNPNQFDNIYNLPPQSFYLFSIGGNGNYDLVKFTDNGEGYDITEILPVTGSPYINTGMNTNRLKVICRGSNIELYANDYLLETVTGQFPADVGDNGIGILAHGVDGTHFAYDNLKMWALSAPTSTLTPGLTPTPFPTYTPPSIPLFEKESHQAIQSALDLAGP